MPHGPRAEWSPGDTMQILGVLNITRDSFSDGGRFLEPAAALAHARALVAAGAAYIDIGAQSTRPDAEEVPVAEELARLTPVVQALRGTGVRISIDAYKPPVIAAMLALGVELINDVTALADADSVAALRPAPARIILMHSVSTAARAARVEIAPHEIMPRIMDFFERRIAVLVAAGIARERLILDPGMGLFVGRAPEVSLTVLRNLARLRAFGLPLCVSTTRKSFLGPLLGTAAGPRPIAERGAGTLASELWALHAGVEYIRTHDVRALHDAATVWQAIAAQPATG
jgi:dihydropteroate synthase type 2